VHLPRCLHAPQKQTDRSDKIQHALKEKGKKNTFPSSATIDFPQGNEFPLLARAGLGGPRDRGKFTARTQKGRQRHPGCLVVFGSPLLLLNDLPSLLSRHFGTCKLLLMTLRHFAQGDRKTRSNPIVHPGSQKAELPEKIDVLTFSAHRFT